MPEVDPVNVEFVIFARVKNAAQMVVPSLTGPKAPVGWLPLSVVKGSQAANFLVKASGCRTAVLQGCPLSVAPAFACRSFTCPAASLPHAARLPRADGGTASTQLHISLTA